jgi:hypothetical protein
MGYHRTDAAAARRPAHGGALLNSIGPFVITFGHGSPRGQAARSNIRYKATTSKVRAMRAAPLQKRSDRRSGAVHLVETNLYGTKPIRRRSMIKNATAASTASIAKTMYLITEKLEERFSCQEDDCGIAEHLAQLRNFIVRL